MTKLTPETEQNIIGELKDFGVSAAVFFDASDIKFSAEFRDMCRSNYCGSYGKNYKCPPSVGEMDDCIAEVRSYDRALLVQTIRNIEDSYDFEGMRDAGDDHAANMVKLREYLSENHSFAGALYLSAGGCKICPKCGILTDTPCRAPDRAISSVEAYCMNVADMTEAHGLHYINGENTVSFVGLVLIRK